MNFNTVEYDELEKEPEKKGFSHIMCVFLVKDENGIVMCDRKSYCDNIDNML